ncbi:iron chelate uptake ABC transporter family permease subunit [Paracoccaceae bacterium GXU_MW_L88]
MSDAALAPMPKPWRPRLALLALALIAVIALAMLWGGVPKGFILELRLKKTIAMLTVGAALGVATILFQTISNNRILTPSIMGFDALYVLIQTALVASLGATSFTTLPPVAKFIGETALMTLAAGLLFGTLLGKGQRDLHRMILTGFVLALFFRALSQFLSRILSPNDFIVTQYASVASFNQIEAELLLPTVIITLLACGFALRRASQFDVMQLGRDPAVSLGLSYERLLFEALAIIALLVATATALVGPVTFFGLIVASLAYSVAPMARHRQTLIAAALLGGMILLIGQILFERIMGQAGTLAIVIEFIGGLLFLWLLLRGHLK